MFEPTDHPTQPPGLPPPTPPRGQRLGSVLWAQARRPRVLLPAACLLGLGVLFVIELVVRLVSHQAATGFNTTVVGGYVRLVLLALLLTAAGRAALSWARDRFGWCPLCRSWGVAEVVNSQVLRTKRVTRWHRGKSYPGVDEVVRVTKQCRACYQYSTARVRHHRT